MAIIALIVLMGLALCPPGEASTIHVPGDQPTIGAGIAAAAPGDTVLVAPGVYTGPSNRDLDFGGKSVVLRSSGGAASAVIDCQGMGRGFDLHSGETRAAVVEGFTVRNGLMALEFGGGMRMSGVSPTVRGCRFEGHRANTGGGMFLAQSSPVVEGCEFTGNHADNWGGGVYAEALSVPELRDCTFTMNTAGHGAGMYVTFSSSAVVTGCTFTRNMPGNEGGGIGCNNSGLTVSGCTFTENEAKQGGGVHCVNGATAVFDSCMFAGNTADSMGGGLYCSQMGPIEVTRCTFTGNQVTAGTLPGSAGGAIYGSEGPSFTISDSEFRGNSALGVQARGGGLYMLSISRAVDVETSRNGGGEGRGERGGGVTVSRCTFLGNYSDTWGGAAYWQTPDPDPIITDCTISDNVALERGGGMFGDVRSFTRCTITGNHAGDTGGGLYLGASASTLVDCVITDNTATNTGGGVYRSSGNNGLVMLMQDCLLLRNSAGAAGGLFIIPRGGVILERCTLAENSAVNGGAVATIAVLEPVALRLVECTLVGNAGSPGYGSALAANSPVEIENSIIAFGIRGVAAVQCGGAPVVLSCTDIYGNAGGDWTGCIAEQFGIDGNFSADPLFCNAGVGDYTLAEISPCAPAHAPAGCGLIGAHPVACVAPIGVADAGAPRVAPLLRVTPNPVREEGIVEWTGAGGAPELRLYDVAGRMVARRATGGEGVGTGRLPWTVLVGPSGVASGVYFLELGGARGGQATGSRIVVIR